MSLLLHISPPCLFRPPTVPPRPSTRLLPPSTTSLAPRATSQLPLRVAYFSNGRRRREFAPWPEHLSSHTPSSAVSDGDSEKANLAQMEQRRDLATILPFLPVILRSSALFWPPQTLASIKDLSLGPDVSRVCSGETLFDAILGLRGTLGLSSDRLAARAAEGCVLFFDELMDRADARAWFGETVPKLARLLMKLPALLEEHYNSADAGIERRGTGLRILGSQDAGIVLFSQELASALLTCSLFCLFPTSGRGANRLPAINFDHLLAGLLPHGKQRQKAKLKCLIHYFERISSLTPMGSVSFERKVLPLGQGSSFISYPEAFYWENSVFPLCPFEVSYVGSIEDQKYEALEVDFANEYLGGGALHSGCVQEEIRFMINPELIVGMLFLPSMSKNEAIEVVGAERFSSYAGYASSFRFVGDYDDKRPFDSLGRRKTRIVAIDALCHPGIMQYGVKRLLRETNKAFCGFLNQQEFKDHMKTFQEGTSIRNNLVQAGDGTCVKSDTFSFPLSAENASHGSPQGSSCKCSQSNTGVSTGNWGCGVFGGDPELKCIIQWLAASQALRGFILYHTFGNETLQRLKRVTDWILMHEWTVGNLWNMLVEYSSQRLNGQTSLGFLNWLLPLHDKAATDVNASITSEK